jgi:hypothetical protein
LVRTIRHFFPELNDWIDDIPDPRFLPFVVYHKRFLFWWGLSLFFFKLGSRRQLDFELDARGTQILDNFNRLADTQQQTRPVNKTLNYFLGGIGAQPVAAVLRRMVRRLLRMKVLDRARLQGQWVVAIDGTGYLVFRERHCQHCLEWHCGDNTFYLHQVLEAKLLGPEELVVSLGTVFIDNSDVADTPAGSNAEERKQDCELKAFNRLDAQLKQTFPQLPICYSGDSLFACGRSLQLAQDSRRGYVFVLKPGRMPAVWQDFQSLLALCPQQQLERVTPAGVRQVYQWVHDLSYTDDQKRTWTFTAIQCQETVDEQTTTWAWITNRKVTAQTVIDVATKGGRHRWHLENQGFNTQKNSGFNLEHVYSHHCWQAFYYLLQIAHLILQLLEKGSLLRSLAQELGQTPVQLFGSLKNIARRLLDSIRYLRIDDAAYDLTAAGRIQIRLDSS